MKTKIDNEKLIMYLEGRIDTKNAPQIEKALLAEAEQMKKGTIVLDAEGLEYISSAGLRVLLKLKKQIGSDLRVENVSPQVYEIFDTTGFTELLDVRKKLREISVEGCEQIGAGVSSKVYRIDRDTIVKVFHPDIGLDRIEEERENARTAFVNGIPTAITFDVVKCGDSYGTVYELIDAVQFSKFLRDNPDKAPEYLEKYARMLKDMHRITLPDKFSDLKDVYRRWMTSLTGLFSQSEIAGMCRLIDGVPDRNTFVHCDAHIGNTMLQDGELILIDMADVGRGHPFFDIGTLCYHYQMIPNTPSRDFGQMTILGFVPETNDFINSVWNEFVKVYFEPQSEKEFMEINGMSRIAGALRNAVTLAKQSQIPEQYKQKMVRGVREYFLPRLEEFTEAVQHIDVYFDR